MVIKNTGRTLKRINELMTKIPKLKTGSMINEVHEMHKIREELLEISNKNGTPLYILDEDRLRDIVVNFANAFKSKINNLKIYYAVKSNPHGHILKTITDMEHGLDVSSGRELKLALDAGSKNILFTGPGKTLSELKLAIKHTDKVIINIDSFSELNRLSSLLDNTDKQIRAGIRVFSEIHGNWSKFGIALRDLKKFWVEASQIKNLKLQGIQFHMSFNFNSEPFVLMLEELANYIHDEFNAEMKKQIKFIDFGGGFISHKHSAYYPWASVQGSLSEIANNYFNEKTEYYENYYIDETIDLNIYAEKIQTCINDKLSFLPGIDYFCEPGRVISDKSMHILLKVLDVKDKRVCITDGGTNIQGWQVWDGAYFPLVNLTHPSEDELPFKFFGSLCTPNDIWGHYCYASKVEEGDIIAVPFHGSYSYAFAQNFIKEIPEVYIFKRNHEHKKIRKRSG